MADSTLIARFVTQSDAAVVCPLGGEVATTLEFEPERRGDTVRSVLDITLTPSGCRFASRGLDFTVDGNPNVHDRSVITTVDGLEEISVEGKDDRDGGLGAGKPLLGPA